METHFLAFGGIGMPEAFLVIAVVLILFGAKKVPELARGMGKGIKEFKKASRDIQDDIEEAMDDRPPPPKPAPDKGGEHWTDKAAKKAEESND